MGKRMKYILCIIVGLFLFSFIGGCYTIIYVGPQLLGSVVPLGVATELYKDEFFWKGIIPDKFKIVSTSFSENESKCKTVLCHFASNDNRIMLIVGKIDESYYGADSVCFLETNYSSLFNTWAEKTVDRIDLSYFLYYPRTILNTRFVPKGKALCVNGMLLDSTYVTTFDDAQVRVGEGMFDRLAFRVVPNGIIIKNYVKELRFNSLQYGVLVFIKTASDKSAFVLLHCKHEDVGLLKEMKESFIQDISHLQIINTLN